MPRWLLTAELIDSPVLGIVGVAALVLLVALAAARPRHPLRMAAAALVGGVSGYVLSHALEAANLFDGPLPQGAAVWAAAGLGMATAAGSMMASRPLWRSVAAVLAIVLALATAGLGVNRVYGVTHSLAAILGVQALDTLPLPAVTGAEDGDWPTLYTRWSPPPDMPATGRVSALSGDERIPAEGFAARDGAIYLPPAALVADPPQLPLLVFMMGQPGTPDPTSLTAALDDFAAAHRGLAPIALVVDQLGAPTHDPACQDSTTFGAVATYVTQDVPAWAREHLNVVDDPAAWTIGGFSNGGSCAWSWAASQPERWGNLLDVSGNEYPGSEHVDATVAAVFAGDRAAFDAATPAAQLAAHPGAYAGHVAVFTHGADDEVFGPGQVANATRAAHAGFTVLSDTVPGAGHTGAALDAGLAFGIAALAPHLGLAPPAS